MTGAEQRASLAASGVPWPVALVLVGGNWEGGESERELRNEKERVCVARSGHPECVVRRYGRSG